MPLRRDHIGWSRQELARCAALTAQGYSAEDAAKRLNAEFHDGKVVRGEASIKMVRQKNGWKVGPKPKTPLPDVPGKETEQEVQHSASESGIEARANGKRDPQQRQAVGLDGFGAAALAATNAGRVLVLDHLRGRDDVLVAQRLEEAGGVEASHRFFGV